MELRQIIENTWEDQTLLKDKDTIIAIKTIIDDLDKGKKRVAEFVKGKWVVNEWIKKAVILYFPIMKMQKIEVGPFQFHDKIYCRDSH